MILTMDIGNTNIKTALFDGKEMYKYWRMSTNITSTSDEYGVRLMSMFAHEGVDRDVVDGIVVSSVVPTINYTIEHMLLNYIGKTPLFVAPGVKPASTSGMRIPGNWAATGLPTLSPLMRNTADRVSSSTSALLQPSASWIRRARSWAVRSAPALS